MVQIIFRSNDWENLTSYLTFKTDVESGVYAVFKTATAGDCQKLLVTDIIVPESKDYFKRSAVRVAFTPEFTEKALQLCEKTNGHLLDIHTHPWSADVEFSPIDDREAKHTKVPYLVKYLPNTKIAFIVFGQSPVIAKARFWDKSVNGLSLIDRIVVI